MKANEYIEKVIQQIQCKQVREEIAEEMKNHLEEAKEHYLSDGFEEKEAEKKAIEQMGNAEEIGKKLNQIHRPKLDWKLVLIIAISSIFGFLVVYIREKRFELLGYGQSASVMRYSIGLVIGVIIAVFIYFREDYHKLLKYSKHLYMIASLFILMSIFSGVRVNGMNYWAIGGFNVAPSVVAVPLFVLAFVGFLQTFDKEKIMKIRIQNKEIKICTDILKVIGLAGISLILLMWIPSLCSAFTLLLVYMILATLKIANSSLQKRKNILLLWGIPVIFGVCLIFLFPYKTSYIATRMLNSFFPENDPAGGGWIGMQQQTILDSANLFGQEEDMGNAINIFGEGTTHAFIAILACYGWVVAIGMVVVVILLNVKLMINGMKIKDTYGKMLIQGVASLFILQSLFNLLMNLNLGIQSSFSIPLISYGRVELIIDLCLLSMVLSIYRRKDMTIVAEKNFEKGLQKRI